MLTLTAVDPATGKTVDHAPFPWELAHWLGANFRTPFATLAGSFDPYGDTPVPSDLVYSAMSELRSVRGLLEGPLGKSIPRDVEGCDSFDAEKAVKMIDEIVVLFELARRRDNRVIAFGD